MVALIRSYRNKKYLLIPLLIIPALLIFLGSRSDATEILAVRVDRGLIRAELSDFGTTKFNNVHTVVAPSSGWISKSFVALGENVTESSTALFSMNAGASPLLDARTKATLRAQAESALSTVSQSKASVRRLRSGLDLAIKELSRNELVFSAGAISQHDIDVVRTQVKNLKEELRAAEASLDAALHMYEASRASLGSSNPTNAEMRTIYAPRSGIISWIYDDKSKFVATGAPVVDIAQAGNLSFEMDLLAREAMQVRSGMRVRFSDFPAAGRVKAISPTALPKISPLGISEQRTRLWVDFDSIPEGPIPAGLELEAHIEIASRDNCLKIPSTSHWTEEQSNFVFVVSDGRIHKTRIKTGLHSLRETEVLEGLRDGDTVVRLPMDDMKDKQKIKVKFE